jgi:hypothetical protein
MSKLYSLRTQHSVMCEVFNRISQNKPFDKKLRPYNKKLIEETINYFISLEEYEKCELLNGFLKERFNHQVLNKKNG